MTFGENPYGEAPLGEDATPLVQLDATLAGETPGAAGSFVVETVNPGDTILAGTTPGAVGEFVAAVVGNATDIANRAGGRRRSGAATARWEPVVVPPPATSPIAVRRIAAIEHSVAVISEDTMPVVETWKAEQPDTRDRVIVDGRDVTYFRGVETGIGGWEDAEPYGWGPTTLSFPQINPAFERLGVGALAWVRMGATVVVQRVHRDTGAVQATDYRGFIADHRISGNRLSVSVGGELTGQASMMDQQPAIFSYVEDLGAFVARAVRECRVPFDPPDGPTTGIRLRRLAGGTGQLEHLRALASMGQDSRGNQWTVHRDPDGFYRMRRKNRTTVRGTVYLDDALVVASLTRDITEEPNRIYMTGVDPNGQRVRFAAYPGLTQGAPAAYPRPGGASFGVGTTNADTTTGDGITVMIARLIVTKFLEDDPRWSSEDTYTQEVAEAVRDLQQQAGVPVTGVMNTTTWAALWDLDATGFSLKWAMIRPAAADPRTQQWRVSGSGAIIGREDRYDPGVRFVDASIDVGSGYTLQQMRAWANREVIDGTSRNWVGTITFATGALISGRHDPGDPHVTPARVLPARSLRAGDNLWLPLFDGGTLVHVSSVRHQPGGNTVAVVDTRARDAAKVWAVMNRERDSRRSPARDWLESHRAVTARKDIGVWDEVGGQLGSDVGLAGGQWTVIPIVAGQYGTVRRIQTVLSPAREYAVAVFGLPVTAKWLYARLGDPLAAGAQDRYAASEAALRHFAMLYLAGSQDDPAGYYPRAKGEPGAALTGVWDDPASFSYFTGEQPVLYLAVFPALSSNLKRGRVMWQQIEAGA